MPLGSTILDLCLSILAATATDAGPQLCARWVNERYVEFVGRARTRQLQHYASVFVPAPLEGGTLSVTQGSNLAVGSGTSFVITNVGWTVRANINWYVVVAVNVGTQTLILDSAYAEQTNATAGYQLVMRYIPTVADCRWISNVTHPRRRRRLRHVTDNEIAAKYPSRQLVGAYPWVWCESARFVEDFDISTALAQTGQKLFEVYPPSSIDETYVYNYWSVPQTLSITSTLPPEVDEYILREGVLIDVYRYKAEQAINKAMEMGNVDLLRVAEIYTNKEARQKTIWEEKIQQALVSDAAFHNQIQIELSPGSDNWSDGDITNAHDDIIYGWTQ